MKQNLSLPSSKSLQLSVSSSLVSSSTVEVVQTGGILGVVTGIPIQCNQIMQAIPSVAKNLEALCLVHLTMVSKVSVGFSSQQLSPLLEPNWLDWPLLKPTTLGNPYLPPSSRSSGESASSTWFL